MPTGRRLGIALEPHRLRVPDVRRAPADRRNPRRLATALFAAALLALPAPQATAIVVSDTVFTAMGGDASRMRETLTWAMEPLRQVSLRQPFLPVGLLVVGGESCTATWIGDSPDRQHAFVLTSRNCVRKGQLSRAQTTARPDTFIDWRGRVVASRKAEDEPFGATPPHTGVAVAPRDSTDASIDADLLVYRMWKVDDILDGEGKPIEQPVLYDGASETGKHVWFAGYGQWGIGSAAPDAGATLPPNAFEPSHGTRRIVGKSLIDFAGAEGNSLVASFAPRDDIYFYSARAAPGDEGAPWWQQHGGYWTIVAVMSGPNAERSQSVGPRLSRYKRWLLQQHPQAVFLTDRYTVTESKLVRSPNLAPHADKGTVAYVVPSQHGVTGPTELTWNARDIDQPHAARLSVTVRHMPYGRKERVYLRAWRELGCGEDGRLVQMNNAISCYDNRSGPLIVAYAKEDNGHLGPGIYDGIFEIEARGWHDRTFATRLPLRVSISVPRL